MNLNEYTNKVKGCFCGKNIGGTLGAPFECKRGVWDLEFYTTDMSNGVLPNDDLDLQLVWLNACEAYGGNVNSEILADYWIAYIAGDWSEYGACKNNLRAGLLPPFSGMYCNHNKNSCGAFIRSEIWACLMPGYPAKAVRYALEDAICDHSDEGVYAEIFCVAVESAAFVENRTDELIEIGLSYIPEDCAVAKAVKLVRECFEKNMDWKEARHRLLTEIPCSFGMYDGYEDREKEDIPVGELGFDAPANIGINEKVVYITITAKTKEEMISRLGAPQRLRIARCGKCTGAVTYRKKRRKQNDSCRIRFADSHQYKLRHT